MGEEPGSRRVLQLFAQVLDYPGPDLGRAARECATLVECVSPQAAKLLHAFSTFVEAHPLGLLEELYTRAFDLGATCYPYIGYYLLGESYNRSLLLLHLRECYQACGMSTGSELPDHVAALLRFLALSEDSVLARELVQKALLPALAQMVRTHDSAHQADTETQEVAPSTSVAEQPATDPYRGVLDALRLALVPLFCAAEVAHGGG
jgi:nitrate reductase delta subunit